MRVAIASKVSCPSMRASAAPKQKWTGPTEGEMAIVCARNVELIRIRKSFRVAIARRHHRDHSLAFANQLTAEFGIFATNARGLLARTFVTSSSSTAEGTSERSSRSFCN